MPGAFEFSGAVHLVEPTGAVAASLRELHGGIRDADLRTLFYHLYEPLLRDPMADEPPPHDFAHWCEHVLVDPEAAERLEFAAVWGGEGLEARRQSLLAVLEDLLRSDRADRASPPGLELRFHRWHTLALHTGLVAQDAHEAVECVSALDDEAFLYQFYEAAEFGLGPSVETIGWLEALGAGRHARVAREVLASWTGLRSARRALLRRWRQGSIASRLVARASDPGTVREGETREVMTRLVRGWRRKAGPEPAP